MSDGDNPMSIEEAKRYMEEHHDEIMQKAERSALNYLAPQRAQEVAAECYTRVFRCQFGKTVLPDGESLKQFSSFVAHSLCSQAF